MAQTNYTPISLYYSTTAAAIPSNTNLVPGELAVNIQDMKLYCENAAGTVTLLASAAGSTGDVVGPASATDNAIVRFDQTTGKLIQNSAVTIADTTGDITGGKYNGLTVSTSTGTLTIVNGSTLVTSGANSLTLTTTATTNATYPSGTFSLGYLNIPQSGSAKTTSYSLATTDIGKVIEVGTGGSITVPNSTFAAGDAIIIFNNTSGSITMTMTITNAYIAGTDADKATIDVATRGVANILFVTGTTCVVTGNVS
jgi:hypothetical protein